MPWGRAGAEYVFDCTGNARAHLDNYFLGGAKRVIVTGSDAADFPSFVAHRNVARNYNKKIKVYLLYTPLCLYLEFETVRDLGRFEPFFFA